MSVSSSYNPPEDLAGLRRNALIAGVVGLVPTVAGAFLSPQQFYRSYLVAFLFWLGVALGSLGILALHHLTGGAWGLMIRRILEAAARTSPVFAILFLPVFLGRGHLFPWADAAKVAASHVLTHRQGYWQVPFFLGRAAFYFLVFWAVSALLSSFSKRQDETADPALVRKMQFVAGPGLMAYAVTSTFAAFDWLMSLNDRWFSSLYGVWFMEGQVLSALAFVILVTLFLSSRAPMEGVYQPRHFHDYGKLLLAFTMLWAYLSVSQFLIIWSGNLPEEITWYKGRIEGSWAAFSLILVFLHFVAPFVLLLSANLKKDVKRLSIVASLLFVMRWVDLYWQAAPAFWPAFHMSWLDVTSTLAIGGIWVWLFVGQLQKRPLLPVNDPQLPQALAHAH